MTTLLPSGDCRTRYAADTTIFPTTTSRNFAIAGVLLICFVSFFFSSRRRHTRLTCDWSSDVCSSDLERISRRGFDGAAIQQHGKAAVHRGCRNILVEPLHLFFFLGGKGSLRSSGSKRSEERRVGKECRSRWWPDQ